MLSLTKGPVCNELSLLKLLGTIEQVILKGYNWKIHEQQSKEQLLAKYRQLYRFKQPLIVAYNVRSINEESVNSVRLAIVREANIRLFDCKIAAEVFDTNELKLNLGEV